jgi:Mce-associated membrane protein
VKTAEAVPSVPVGDDDEEFPAGDLEKLRNDDGDSAASSRLRGTDSETRAATAPPATVDGPVRSSRRLLLPAVGVVAVAIFVVLAVGLLHYRSKAHSSQETAAARTQAVKAASTYAVEVGSYQYQHLKQDFAKISDNSTPSYATIYLRQTTALSKLLVQYKADSTATILDAGVQSATPSRVVVLVYINQRSSNSLSKKLTNSRSLIKFTLVEHKGRWIIDGITDDV